MTDKPRDENRSKAEEPNTEQEAREERDDRDDLARRRESMRQAQLTNREREQRWPIG